MRCGDNAGPIYVSSDRTSSVRILHTMLRVGNLQRSIDFYTSVLGMRLLRQSDHPAGKFTLAFVGYEDESEASAIELTYNYGVERYEQIGRAVQQECRDRSRMPSSA
eukprot:TRINITY_DN20682_c0_g1_i1.p1 TRINITY_DN20682_c0_g1~~TRINITY_DN20682_c0_g1_i1.p1  ORF type:complete len:107 (-),score=25.66 TRINITY_DN20682_c0_g1_i1:10-330(-)